jgi:hypothetical protein
LRFLLDAAPDFAGRKSILSSGADDAGQYLEPEDTACSGSIADKSSIIAQFLVTPSQQPSSQLATKLIKLCSS